MVLESKIDVNKVWYLGNNQGPNLKLMKPDWSKPLFLTTDIDYAATYSDYGIWKVTLDKSVLNNILDFKNRSDVKKLNWPKLLIDKINKGDSDLNSIARDLYAMINGESDLYQIEDTPEWAAVAAEFDTKIEDSTYVCKKSHWNDEPDYKVLIQMWHDIYEAKFDGFTHYEFGHDIIALFNIEYIDKISVNKVSDKTWDS